MKKFIVFGSGGGVKSKLALAALSLIGLGVIILMFIFAAVAAVVLVPVGLVFLVLPRLLAGKPKKKDDGIIDAEFTEVEEEEQEVRQIEKH